MATWTEMKYGGYDMNLGRGLVLSVFYEGVARLPDGASKINVTVFGVRLKERSPDYEHAKKRAVFVARKWLSEAQTALTAD